jgi:hypothetical protein
LMIAAGYLRRNECPHPNPPCQFHCHNPHPLPDRPRWNPHPPRKRSPPKTTARSGTSEAFRWAWRHFQVFRGLEAAGGQEMCPPDARLPRPLAAWNTASGPVAQRSIPESERLTPATLRVPSTSTTSYDKTRRKRSAENPLDVGGPGEAGQAAWVPTWCDPTVQKPRSGYQYSIESAGACFRIAAGAVLQCGPLDPALGRGLHAPRLPCQLWPGAFSFGEGSGATLKLPAHHTTP